MITLYLKPQEKHFLYSIIPLLEMILRDVANMNKDE